MKIQSFLVTLVAAMLLLSCSDDLTNRSASDATSAYLKDNQNAVMFGRIDLKTIFEKAEYKSIPKLSVLLIDQMKQLEQGADLEQGIHYVVEGPFASDGTPANVIAFIKVNNADSLSSKIVGFGHPMQEDGDMEYTQDNDVSIGIQEGLAVVISRKAPYDGKAELLKVFEKCQGELSTGKVAEILKEKGDLTLGMSLENLYMSSNTDLSSLSKAKKQEIEAMVKDSYVKGSVSFEEGKAVFESHNLFSSSLMSRIFLKEDPSAEILNKLGKGNAYLGLAMNFDVEKIENFLDDFAPNVKKDLMRGSNFMFQMLLAGMGNKPVTNLWNGELGLVAVGNLNSDGSLIPEFNLYMGMGKQGKSFSELIRSYLELPASNTDTYSNYMGMMVKANEKELMAYSVKGSTGQTELVIPPFASGFGKKGFTSYINFEGMNLESLGLGMQGKAIYAFKNIYMEADQNGTKMIITAKKPTGNILKQIVDIYVKDIENTVGGFNM